jgi:hypothetical protein
MLALQEEQAQREAALMAECTFQPTLRGRRTEGPKSAGAGSHAEAPVLVRGLNRHLELQARLSSNASLAACFLGRQVAFHATG